MEKFNYEIISETEKAVCANVPYWEATSVYKRFHKQLNYQCWIPKSVLQKSDSEIKSFVINVRNEKRLKNAYQRRCDLPKSWNTMGEWAPKKVKEVVVEVDTAKLAELKMNLMIEYKCTQSYDHSFFINPHDNITDEVEDLARAYRRADINHPAVPKHNVTYYK